MPPVTYSIDQPQLEDYIRTRIFRTIRATAICFFVILVFLEAMANLQGRVHRQRIEIPGRVFAVLSGLLAIAAASSSISLKGYFDHLRGTRYLLDEESGRLKMEGYWIREFDLTEVGYIVEKPIGTWLVMPEYPSRGLRDLRKIRLRELKNGYLLFIPKVTSGYAELIAAIKDDAPKALQYKSSFFTLTQINRHPR